MVQSDKALSSRLSIVTMPLTETVWPQFAMQNIFARTAVHSFVWRKREFYRGSD